MRLTKQSNYAVRALMYCALNNEKLTRIADIAAAYSISELFLFKIIRPLVDGGLVKTTRGRNGGIALALPAKDISVFDVISLTEDSFALAECFDGGETPCPLVNNCRYNVVLLEAREAFFAVLREVTIADLVEQNTVLSPLLGLDAETENA